MDLDVQDTWVDKIRVTAHTLSFDVEFSLLPSHPLYADPLPGEWTCYRRGRLAVEGFGALSWKAGPHPIHAEAGADGRQDFDAFDSILVDGTSLTFYGAWGAIVTDGGSLVVHIDEDKARPAQRPAVRSAVGHGGATEHTTHPSPR